MWVIWKHFFISCDSTTGQQGAPLTWSSLLVCRSRCRRKSKREHLRTRMRSVVPSARWAAGDRPLGLRGHAQLMLAALMARNLPRIVRHSPSLSAETEREREFTALCWLKGAVQPRGEAAARTHRPPTLRPPGSCRWFLGGAARCDGRRHSWGFTVRKWLDEWSFLLLLDKF